MPVQETRKAALRSGSANVPGWERLRHGGLLLDGTRLASLASHVPAPIDAWTERQVRQRANTLLEGSGEPAPFVTFVLEQVCGLDAATGAWTRGNQVARSWGRRAVTGENVKPHHLWQGRNGARLPVFLDDAKRLGIGRSRRGVSRVLGWLRAGGDHLALITNGRQWRLVFAGLDHDAWCEWDIDLWFEEGELAPQVTALRTLFCPQLWTPETGGAEPRLLIAIRDTRKGQAELSEVLGERVREAVEILIRAHGDALSSLVELEGVREYVEYLADDAGVAAPAADEVKEMFGASHADIYRAACRVAMRLVVILFAESRELLPRDNTLYHESYGLHGLLERLERAAARGSGLADSFTAWPRILALFALVRDGSHHPDLPVTAYGGELFAPGAMDGEDGVSRALRVYEQACFDSEVMPDRDVHDMLQLLTRTTIRIRQGRSSIRTAAPVDFSDLSSEYIGILYEGLLDYELKTAPASDPVVFLAVGDQPALPLSRLEAMDDQALRILFEKLKDKSGTTDELPEEQEAEAAAPDVGEDTEDESLLSDSADAPPEHIAPATDERQSSRTRAEKWARRAVQAARLLKRPRGRDTPERRLAFEERLAAKARQLVARVVLPGEWYLVRWGGTRKGSGSFYTRPGLAVPTVQRTLRPLAYDPPAGTDGKPDADAPPARWTPKPPERILDLTVCDPACGSGTFPLAALRFLTDALYAALQRHDRLRPDGDRVLVHLLGLQDLKENDGGQSRLADELIPCRPDDDSFESRLKAVLRRHVVERCIYAVDVDPLAVELCRLSLWIETMDRTLPFGFLDHKIKCGNSLIGAWFDQFPHYPVMAWKNREGGDKSHSNGVHFRQNARTKAIKGFVKTRLTPDLRTFLQGSDLFQLDLLERSATAHYDALAVLERMHAMPVQDAAARARLYRDALAGSAAWRSLKGAMDLWCACWFWPADDLEHAPLPSNFANPSEATRAAVRRIAGEMHFFHWELEFPDVFRRAGSGFDAILGNPPWETLQPNSMEYFSNIDPLYRSYGKQEALRRQKTYFSTASVEQDWLHYSGRFANGSNWMKHTGNPFGDPEQTNKGQNRFTAARGKGNSELHNRWRTVRSRLRGYCDPPHPFVHRGEGKAYTYKLFLEQAHALLHSTGRMGFIVPSGLYSDDGASKLRALLLGRCRWEWLFCIENHLCIFPIHRSYKFNPIIAEKGGVTKVIRTAFMRRNLDDWERADTVATPYTRAQVERFSPESHVILEIQSRRDLEILDKLYSHAVPLQAIGSHGSTIRNSQGDFNMTSDSKLFPPRPQWEASGYQPDEYSRWILGSWKPIAELWEKLCLDVSSIEYTATKLEDWLFDKCADPDKTDTRSRFVHGHWLQPGDVTRTGWRRRCAQPPYDQLPIPRGIIPPGVILSRDGCRWIMETDIQSMALPVYQGVMIHAFVASAQSWTSGTGLRAKWTPNRLEDLEWNPQFLMHYDDAQQRDDGAHLRIGYRRVGRNTDARSFIGAILPSFPCGDAVFTLRLDGGAADGTLCITAFLNSFVFDWVVRHRLGATNLNWYIVAECALPEVTALPGLARVVKKLNLSSVALAGITTACSGSICHDALHRGERTRSRAILDAVCCAVYGCNSADVRHILRHCDLPLDEASSPRRLRSLDARGFWRIDGDLDPELRHTVLTIVAFDDLQRKIDAAGGKRERGIEDFLSQNDGEGWMLPETLRLADYGLGHDDRAREAQPVASRLGPRFYDWQLVQSVDESWRECHLHARNLLGEHDYALRIVELIAQRRTDGEDHLDLLTDSFKRSLLGDEGYVTTLVEIRARELLYEGAYWTLVADLRNAGHLDESGYSRLLDRLHARELLDDIGYRRRQERGMPAPGAELPAQRVAETRAGHQADLFPKDKQGNLLD